MAVINSPYVGNARGKLGEAVFLRSKGNTVARAYNPSPANRRTYNQQAQRSIFSSAVKFFSRGVQNLFVFAFEHKRTQESDYNAFMRYNAKRGIYFGPEQNDDDTYPALGPFVMTRGSLGLNQVSWGTYGPSLDVASSLRELPILLTWGDVSRLLVDLGFSDKDIITYLFISTDSQPGSPAQPIVGNSAVPDWALKQFTVDLNNVQPVEELGISVTLEGPGIVRVAYNGWVPSDVNIEACTVVVSRIVNGTLRVSNSDLLLNEPGRLAYDYGTSREWRLSVMSAWGAERDTILQGGISTNDASPEGGIRVAYTFTTPLSSGALDGGRMIFFPAQPLDSFIQGLYMEADGGTPAQLVASQGSVRVSIPNDTTYGWWYPDPSSANAWVFASEVEGDVGPIWSKVEFNAD